MKLYSKIFLTGLIWIGTWQAGAAQQKLKISGNIYDAQTKSKLPFVNVVVMNTNRGTMADQNGYFELLLPAQALNTANAESRTYELMFSMIGYQSRKQKISASKKRENVLNIQLTPTVVYLPGVTIIAPKTTQQRQNESVSSYSFETKKIKDLPFSFNDVNRALKTLPGISSNNEKSSEFNVRGGSFEENLVQIDGVTVYRPFHLKEMPNASISILSMALMDRVNLITGGFPAKYGDKMSSVLSVNYRNGCCEKLASQIEIGVINTNILLEGPLSKNGSWILGFNKSHLEPSMKIMNRYFPEFLESIHGTPKFYDLQGKVNYNFNRQHQIFLLFLNSTDNYDETPRSYLENYSQNYSTLYRMRQTEDISKFNAKFRNTLMAVHFSNQLNSSILSRTMFSRYDEIETLQLNSEHYDHNQFYYLSNDESHGFISYENVDRYGLNLETQTYEIKNDLTFKITPYHELEGGSNFKQIKYLYNLNDRSERLTYNNYFNYPDTTKIDTIFYEDNYHDQIELESTTYKIGGYLQDNWQISDRIFFNLGLRADYFDFNKNLNISPRISGSLSFQNGGLLKLAWGHYFQSPMYYEFKLKTASSANTENQKAIHYIIGYQQKLKNLFEIKLDGYYKDYFNLIPYYLRSGYKLSTQQNDATGFAKGFDIQLKYNLSGAPPGHISGWLSYGFMIAKEKTRGDSTVYYPRTTDQRHSISMILDWNITDKWRLYTKFLYGSGFPFTPTLFDLTTQKFTAGPKNSEYLPAYQRVDLRISRNFTFSSGNFNIFLEVINLLNRKNIYTYEEYGISENGEVSRRAKRLLPITPNIGMKIIF